MTYTALVAEDEALVREIAVEILQDAGFTVLEAEHAEEALLHLQTGASRIHLLFTDIHMPGKMDGLALARQANRDWPSVAILIASARPRPQADQMPPGSRFISKPYSPGSVVEHARELTGAT